MTSVLQRDLEALPTELTSFVGRRHELAEIRQALGQARLLTLTGVGGVGKTRLALRAAAKVEHTFSDGVGFVELADLATPELLADKVASDLGLAGHPNDRPGGELEAFVANRHMLLVLDNCEHVLDACAALIERLLSVSRGLHVLATSRQSLGLAGERTITVSSLSVPESQGFLRPEMLDQYDGVTLFLDRVRAVVPGFRITDDNCALIVELCQKLDGIPLAIELASSRMRAFSLPQLLELINDRFALLTTGNRSGPTRQQTLRALIDWSFGLCTVQERALWSRLSVFAGGFDVQAAEQVCSGNGLDPAAIADILASLAEKSIVIRTEWNVRARYRMLETIRQYGHDRLAETGERKSFKRRHRDWCYRLTSGDPESRLGSPGHISSYQLAKMERPNLQAALEFSLDEEGDGHEALELAATLCMYRWACSSLSQGRHWLDHVLRRVQEPSPERAKALWVNAWLALLQGDTPTARSLLAESQSVAETVDDQAAMVYVTQFSGLADLFEGNPSLAVARLTEAVRRRRELDLAGNSWLAATQLVSARCFAGDPEAGEALRSVRESLAGLQPPTVVHAYLSWSEAIAKVTLGDMHRAALPAAEALRIAADAGERWLTWICMEAIAWSAAAVGDCARAARLLGAAETARAELGANLSGLDHLRPHHEAAVRVARERLGEEVFEASYQIGAGMKLAQAVALGINGTRPARSSPAAATKAKSPLTRREREIANLVAEGLSNKQIATKLVVAQRTAETHVGHILTKLGFTSRSQIAAWAAEQASHQPA